MVAWFLQACGGLLGGYSSWDKRLVLLDKEKGLTFFFFFFPCSTLHCARAIFILFFYPRDGMRQSIGCFHGLVSDRALQKLKRWVIIKSSSC